MTLALITTATRRMPRVRSLDRRRAPRRFLVLVLSLTLAIASLAHAKGTEELFAEAQAWENAGQWSLAMSVYQKILKDEPTNAKAHYRLGVNFLKLGMANEAIDSFKAALGADPGHTEARDALEGVFVSRAIDASSKGRPQDALRALEEGVAASPSSATAHLELARELKRQGQDGRSIEEYTKAIGADPKGSSAALELAELYASKQQYSEAAAQFEEAIRREPRNAAAHHGLGLSYQALGQRDKAIAELDQAMRFYMLAGQEDKAIAAMSVADKLKAEPLSKKPR